MANQKFSLSHRSSGVLLHPTSLPGPHGIGDMGPSAYEFAHFLSKAGQRWWQMLPLGPLGYGSSPYNSCSAMAGNPLLISLNLLQKDGLLDKNDLREPHGLPKTFLNYDDVRDFKTPRLQQAYHRFEHSAKPSLKLSFDSFIRSEAFWLDDFSLFLSLKDVYHGASWLDWGKDFVRRSPAALRAAKRDLAHTIRFHQFEQFIFQFQWRALRQECAKLGVGLIGDVPIFVAHDSADVWSHQDLFKLDSQGHPLVVAGVPPDYFSKTGQLWGNPVYQWSRHRKNDFAWWRQRLSHAFQSFDALRLDHFLGFLRTWEVPAKAKTAEKGHYVPGPKDHFFTTIGKHLGHLELVAEDLGKVIPAVPVLRKKFKMPGMFVLQFIFGADFQTARRRIDQIEKRTVVYTGTHDNDTIIGWFRDRGSIASTRTKSQIENERANVLSLLKTSGREINWDMIALALSTPANVAIIPAQDLLGLDSSSRMNTPGTMDHNWQWRAKPGSFTQKISSRLRKLTKKYNR